MHTFMQCCTECIQNKSWCFECCTIPKSPTRYTHTNRIPRDFNNSGKRCHTRLAPKKKAYSISNRARYYRFWPLMSACAPTTVGSKKRMCGDGRRLRYEPTILTRCRWKQQLCLCSSSAGSPPPFATPSYAALPRETRLAHCLLYDDSLTLPCSPSHSSTVS